MVATVEQDIELFEAFQGRRLHSRVVVVRASLCPLCAGPPCGAQEWKHTLDHALEELNERAGEQRRPFHKTCSWFERESDAPLRRVNPGSCNMRGRSVHQHLCIQRLMKRVPILWVHEPNTSRSSPGYSSVTMHHYECLSACISAACASCLPWYEQSSLSGTSRELT